MPRNPAEIINAIIANLQMAHEASFRRYQSAGAAEIAADANGEGRAFREAMRLVRVEAKDLLEAQS